MRQHGCCVLEASTKWDVCAGRPDIPRQDSEWTSSQTVVDCETSPTTQDVNKLALNRHFFLGSRIGGRDMGSEVNCVDLNNSPATYFCETLANLPVSTSVFLICRMGSILFHKIVMRNR